MCAFYRPPSVYAREEIGAISPTAIPRGGMVAIVSEVPKSIKFREYLELSGTAEVDLQKRGIRSESVQVFNRSGLEEYIEGEDFTISTTDPVDYVSNKGLARVENAVQGETFTLDSGSDRYSLENGRGVHDIVVSSTDPDTSEVTTYSNRTDYAYDPSNNQLIALTNGTIPRDGTTLEVSYKHGIEDGQVVRVEYRYADEDYFSQVVVDSYLEVENRFGPAWNEDGTPNPMSFAASLAFANGGLSTMVLCVPVNPYVNDESNGDVNLVDYQRAVDEIVDDEVGLVIETSGNINVQSAVIQNTIAAAEDFEQPRMTILGRNHLDDGVTREEFKDYARAMNQERVVVVSPLRWKALNRIQGEYTEVGGQYAAAALAGLLSGMNVQETPTRDLLTGIMPLESKQSEGLMNSDAGDGLCVIENRSGTIRVRHGITTARGDRNKQEINVVRAKDFIIKTLKEVLDPVVIGRLIEPNLDMVAQATASRVLDSMQQEYVLADYETPDVQLDPSNVTRLILSFRYRPNYAINEVLISFALTDFGASTLQDNG